MPPAVFPRCCPHSRLGFTVVDDDATTVTVAVRGEIDLDNAEHLTHVLVAVLRRAPSGLVADLAGVSFLGAAGIGALVACHAEAVRAERRFTLINPRPMPRRVLEITGLADLLHPAASRPAIV